MHPERLDHRAAGTLRLVNRQAPVAPDCKVCGLPSERRRRVNDAIWDAEGQRVPTYRADGAAAASAVGLVIDRRTITRHAAHIEASWQAGDGHRYAPAVFSPSHEALVDAAARVGAKAMTRLEARIDAGDLADRELLGAAKLGVTSRAQQEAIKQASKAPQLNVMAIFGIAGGHLAALPESEAIEVTPEEDLRAEVARERAALRLAAG